jgi:integrase
LISQRRGVLPKGRPGRDRRLLDGEQGRLEKALLAGGDGEDMLALWRVLLDTGMRLGEALGLTVAAVRGGDRSLMLMDTKNGSSREVLLSDQAWNDLSIHAEGLDAAELLFPGQGTVDHRWKLARKAAKVKGFRIHDLRHEALSRMAARGVDLKTMMLQSGHKTPAMLLRYLNPTREERRRALFGEPTPSTDQAPATLVGVSVPGS